MIIIKGNCNPVTNLMKFFNKTTSNKIVLIIAVFLSVYIIKTGAYIRWLGYERIPDIGIFDERNYALQGLSIRNNGVPAAWSDSGAYEYGFHPEDVQAKFIDLSIVANGLKPNLKNYPKFPKPLYIVREYDFGFGKQQLKLVQPFMDHSPIGGLISSLGFKDKVSNFTEITPDKYRVPALYIGILNSILLIIFTYLITKNVFIGIVSIGIYNSVPIYILSSRFALLENYLIPFTLIQLIFLLLSKKVKHYSLLFLFMSGLVSGLGILIKETGVGFAIGSVVLLFLWRSNLKEKIAFLSAAFLPCVTYAIWSLWLSPQLFKDIVIFNSSRRFLGSLSFLSILPTLRFPNFPLDGWWIWGFISLLFLSSLRLRKYYILLLPFLCHILTVLFLPNMNYPWYFLATVPFLVVASAIILFKIIKNPKFSSILSFALIPLSSSLYWGNTVYNFPPNINIYRLVVFGFIFIGLIRIIKSKSKIIQLIWYIACIAIFYEIYKWNRFSTLYIIDHWGKLPFPSFPAL